MVSPTRLDKPKPPTSGRDEQLVARPIVNSDPKNERPIGQAAETACPYRPRLRRPTQPIVPSDDIAVGQIRIRHTQPSVAIRRMNRRRWRGGGVLQGHPVGRAQGQRFLHLEPLTRQHREDHHRRNHVGVEGEVIYPDGIIQIGRAHV